MTQQLVDAVSQSVNGNYNDADQKISALLAAAPALTANQVDAVLHAYLGTGVQLTYTNQLAGDGRAGEKALQFWRKYYHVSANNALKAAFVAGFATVRAEIAGLQALLPVVVVAAPAAGAGAAAAAAGSGSGASSLKK